MLSSISRAKNYWMRNCQEWFDFNTFYFNLNKPYLRAISTVLKWLYSSERYSTDRLLLTCNILHHGDQRGSSRSCVTNHDWYTFISSTSGMVWLFPVMLSMAKFLTRCHNHILQESMQTGFWTKRIRNPGVGKLTHTGTTRLVFYKRVPQWLYRLIGLRSTAKLESSSAT